MKSEEIDQQIITLLSEGYTAKEIAGKVFLSPDAIRKRIMKLKETHDCKNTTHLIAKMTPGKDSKSFSNN